MKQSIFLCLLVLTLIPGCQNSFLKTKGRIPTNTDQLTKILTNIQIDSQKGVDTYKECFQKTNASYESFYELNHSESNLNKYSIIQLENLLEASFKSRLNILRHIKTLSKNFNHAKADAHKCLTSVRNLTRALRYFEDYVIENLELSDERIQEKYTTLEGKGSYFLVNPNFTFEGSKDLKSGDVILSRGNAYTSAAIARIGTIDAQFSHVTSVYKDESGKLHTTEAHIEIGSVVMPWSTHVEQGNAREVVFRYKDAKVAHQAAKFIYEKVKKFSAANKHNINYDFSMNYKENSDLFCSEVVSSGIFTVTNSKVDIPRYKTKFSKDLIPFLQTIGIGVTKDNIDTFDTFGPGDLEFDDRFELIAEWRKPTKLRGIRMKDAVLTKMFEWMGEKKYKLRQGIKIPLSTYVAWTARRLPFIKKGLIEKFPLNMKPKLLGTFLVLDEVGDILLSELEKRQDKVKYPLSFREMYAILENFRKSDSKLKRRRSKLHKKFRP
jgi:hypothetical protein